MAFYRLYYLNQGGHITRVNEFEATDDASAVTKAQLEGTPPMELWCAERRVEQWYYCKLPICA